MRDWNTGRLRYLVHFSDGGSGTRWYDESLDEGVELHDGGPRYVVERVEQPPEPDRAWARMGDHDRVVGATARTAD